MTAFTLTYPVLSLCIPTYNRANLLRQALEAAMVQANENVEIVVSDNASTDGTEAVLAEIASASPGICLRVFRQVQNWGPDANIYEAVKQARGEFVYILSDDDVLLPGAVEKLFSLIEAYPNCDAFALNIRSFAVRPDEDSPVWFAGDKDAVVLDRNAALACFRPMQLMFLSVFAFRRTLALARDYSQFAGTNLLQSYLFLDVLARGGGLVVTAKPFLAQRKDNTGGWTFWKVMTTNLHTLMNYAQEAGFPPAVISTLMQRHLTEDLYIATRYFKLMPPRASFTPRPAAYWDGIKRLLRIYGAHPFLLFRLIPLILTPSLLLRQVRRLYHLRQAFRKDAPAQSSL